MKRILLAVLCLITPAIAAAADQCPAPQQVYVDTKKTPIPLCLVAQKVASTLEHYNSDPNTIKGALPNLKSAEFDFKTVSSTTEGFKFSILIFGAGVSHASQAVNDVTFSYEVPAAPAKPPGMTFNEYGLWLGRKEAAKPRDFSKDLITTLQQAAQQIKTTGSIGAATFRTLKVTLAYGATWDFNGSAALPISLVTLGGTLDHSRADTQTLTLTFENPSAPKK